MDKSVSYSDLNLLNSNPVKNVEQFIEHGAGSVELMMDGCFWNDINHQAVKLGAKLTEYNVEYSLHPPAWDTNLTSENKAIREASCNEYQKAILFASLIEAKYVVIHPGFTYAPVFGKTEARKRAGESIAKLNEVAKPAGIKLAVENVGYGGTAIFTCDEYVEFVAGLDDNIGYIIDTGHAFLNNWDIPELIQRTKSRLLALHLHDNNGTCDEHLVIGQGIIDWEPVYESLRATATNFKLVLEYRPGTPTVELQDSKDTILKNLCK